MTSASDDSTTHSGSGGIGSTRSVGEGDRKIGGLDGSAEDWFGEYHDTGFGRRVSGEISQSIAKPGDRFTHLVDVLSPSVVEYFGNVVDGIFGTYTTIPIRGI